MEVDLCLALAVLKAIAPETKKKSVGFFSDVLSLVLYCSNFRALCTPYRKEYELIPIFSRLGFFDAAAGARIGPLPTGFY